MYEKELQFISTQIKELASLNSTENKIEKTAELSKKLDSEHVLNFIKFFAR